MRAVSPRLSGVLGMNHSQAKEHHGDTEAQSTHRESLRGSFQTVELVFILEHP
jgi:hypothetical protein